LRVVFDTNIFVSALAVPGERAEAALRRIIQGEDDLLVSRAMIRELLDVLARKFSRGPEELARVAVFVAELGELVEPTVELTVLSDERDNRVLECAVAGHAEAIVTGDQEMLDMRECEGVRIVTLAAYLGSGRPTDW
jgi:putative PIN family toxin of toxin-antitoxin system